MALIAADIAIINLALMRIGSAVPVAVGIESETTNEARVALLMYARCRDYVLTQFDWACATKRAALAGQAASTVTLWAYSYTYPSDCLKARRVLGATNARYEPIPFQVLNTGSALVILTNEASASLEYTVDMAAVPGLFDPIFESALGYYLASELALGLRAAPEVAKGALDAYSAIMGGLQERQQQEGLSETTLSAVDGTTSTQVVLYNTALSRLGYPAMISATTEVSTAARACNIHYSRLVTKTLEAFPWNFATRWVALVAAADTAPTKWGYVYDLPADCLVVREIYTGVHNPTNAQRIEYEIGWGSDKRVLLANVEEVEICYTSSTVDDTVWDAHFKDALTFHLAADIAPVLGVDTRVIPALMQGYYATLSRAQARSLNEGFEGVDPDCEFITGRS